ncbi:protein-L-isoaspartate(D-aspartate) O-methyltransferase [Methylobacterium longum]|uniref:protein-L-isoaspartate(D-aspartate) O-methyltransferase n=1 Tax=Methylobacterium longum TaxID=767694 RepID=UPI003570D152
MSSYSRARTRMVDVQIARRGVRDEDVLQAMRSVSREAFVEPGSEEFAYEDGPLPIGHSQTISQPYIVALMIEAAELGPRNRVLEVGAGSGYAAAVASRIAEQVYAIERHPSLGEAARRRFAQLGYGNIELRVSDGTRGWPEVAPFDAILVSAGSPEVPHALKEQLTIGGRLVIPVGDAHEQRLLKLTRRGESDYEKEECGAVSFVPLIGEQGWAENGRRPTSDYLAGQPHGKSVPAPDPGTSEPLPAINDQVGGLRSRCTLWRKRLPFPVKRAS